MRALKLRWWVVGFTLLMTLMMAGVVAAEGAVDAAVDVVDNEFVPATVTINLGEMVTWTRVEGFHNIVADDGSWGNEPGGDWVTFSHTFETAGTFEYYCEIHSSPDGDSMNGTVVVQAPTSVTLGTLSSGGRVSPWGYAALGAGLLSLAALAGARARRR